MLSNSHLMKTLKFLAVLLPGILPGPPAQGHTPVIINQPTTVAACEGDTVTLTVVTDSVYDYQWFTASRKGTSLYDLSELSGEQSNRLTFCANRRLPNADGIFYVLRIINEPDTVWSQEIAVSVPYFHAPFYDYYAPFATLPPFEDTIHVNSRSRKIGFHPSLNVFEKLVIHSGDTLKAPFTDKFIEFDNPGKHWLKYGSTGCDRGVSFQVVFCPKVMHIDTLSEMDRCWCADTVYIDRDVSVAGVKILPGTVIKFSGNYWLHLSTVDAVGAGADSIWFVGNIDHSTKSRQGKMHLFSYSDRSMASKLSFKNLESLNIFGGGGFTILNNDLVELYEGYNYRIGGNKIVRFQYRISNSYIFDNDSLMGIPGSSPRGWALSFCSERNIFYSNKTGLNTSSKYNNSGPYDWPALISNNIFVNNQSTAIVCNTKSNYISQNLFIRNSSSDGPAVFSGVSHVNFKNNTLYNNSSPVCNGVGIRDLTTISGSIVNNIFWNANSGDSPDILINESASEQFKISNNSFRGDTLILQVPADTAYHVKDNLFNTWPDFVDTLHQKFSVNSNSPVIDNGIEMSDFPSYISDRITSDFAGFPRRVGDAIDLGAYEYHSFAPLAFRYVTPDTIVCSGDSITLKAIPGILFREDLYNIDWYLNDIRISSDSNEVFLLERANSDGIYMASLSNGLDTIWSRPILVTVLLEPRFIYQPLSVQVCSGQDAVFRLFPIETAPTGNWYSLNYGALDTASIICRIKAVTENDVLFVVYENMCGSDTSDLIYLFVNPSPEPYLGQDTTLFAADSMLLDAGPQYQSYLWSNGSQQQQLYAHAGDTLTIRVSNQYSCSGSDTMVIFLKPEIINAVHLESISCVIYPNPAGQKLNIKMNGNALRPCFIEIFSQNGRLVFESEFSNPDETMIDVSSFEAGVYVLQIRSGSASGSALFVVN